MAVGVLALLAMCAYPPLVYTNRYGQTEWAYGWLWKFGSIDTARLGLQCLLAAVATGLLAYGLRPAGTQAIAKRTKLAIQALAKRKKLLIVSVVVIVTVGAALNAVGVVWEALHWWWDSLPPEQVSKISVVALLTDEQVLGLPPAKAEPKPTDLMVGSGKAVAEEEWEPSDPFVDDVAPPPLHGIRLDSIADPLDEILANPPPQQQPLLVKNSSGEALRAISIRIYYPGVPVPSTHDRLPCFVSPGGQTGVTVWMEHYYTLPLRVEVVEAWRQ